MDNQLHRPNGALLSHRSRRRGASAVRRRHRLQHRRVLAGAGSPVLLGHAPLHDLAVRPRRCVGHAVGPPRLRGPHAPRRRPDGACVDAEGYVWNAIFAAGRVVRYTPRGAGGSRHRAAGDEPDLRLPRRAEAEDAVHHDRAEVSGAAQSREEPLAGRCWRLRLMWVGWRRSGLGGECWAPARLPDVMRRQYLLHWLRFASTSSRINGKDDAHRATPSVRPVFTLP